MPHFSLSRTLPYKPDDMYGLVSEISRYPDFLHWITSLEATPIKAKAGKKPTCEAEVEIGYGSLKETFSTRLVFSPAEKRVDIKLLRGPLKRLDAIWKISAESVQEDMEISKIYFEMVYTFNNPFLAIMAKINMNRAVEKVMDAFTQAAGRYYQPVPISTSPHSKTRTKYNLDSDFPGANGHA